MQAGVGGAQAGAAAAAGAAVQKAAAGRTQQSSHVSGLAGIPLLRQIALLLQLQRVQLPQQQALVGGVAGQSVAAGQAGAVQAPPLRLAPVLLPLLLRMQLCQQQQQHQQPGLARHLQSRW